MVNICAFSEGMYRNKEVKKKSERGKEKIYDEMSFYSVFLYTMSGNYIVWKDQAERYRGYILEATVC